MFAMVGLMFSAGVGSMTMAAAANATSVRLILPVDTVRPGDTFIAGVELTMQPGWHTYWRNGGDSGSATTIEWTIPTGVSAGEIRWPVPERYESEGFITFVYHDKVTLLVPISVGPDVAAGSIELAARVTWLECEKLCVQGNGDIRARLTVADTLKPSADAGLIRAAEERLPKPLPKGAVRAAWDGPPTVEVRSLIIQWRDPAASGTPDFFPFAGTGYTVATMTERPASDGEGVTLRKKVTKVEGGWPSTIGGLLVVLDPKRKPVIGYDASLEPAEASIAPAAGVSTREESAARLSLSRAVMFGFLGGMILNVMPCVLPVIALKILGFVRQSGSRPVEIRKLGLVYGLGVWFSFLVLAGVVIGVKQAAGFAGWGMQFGNPIFLVAMTTLVLLVALSLFGIFELNLVGGRAMDAAGELASKEGSAGAFFNGMLAVALATPCTAPFLAPALGYAFAADTFTIVTVFSAIAFGLAAPYVLLSWQPALLRFLPKPGAWMEHFKVAMGFPMLATALWLYTLAAAHFGEAGPLWLGIFLLGIALAGWVWGEFVQRGRRHRAAAMVVALTVVGLSYGFALEGELNWRVPREIEATTTGRANPGADEIPWQPWSSEAVEAARSAGRPVFVDFTANWCLTCKLNERSSINVRSVREKLRAIDAVALKGDYTRFPPAITRELHRFGRAGVPLVLVYPRNPEKQPRVLPEVLTPGLVIDELENAVLY